MYFCVLADLLPPGRYLTTGYYAPRHFSRLFHFPLTRAIPIVAPPSHRLSGLLDLVLGRLVHATYLRKYVIVTSETIAPRLASLAPLASSQLAHKQSAWAWDTLPPCLVSCQSVALN